jgi:hypothetical protein
LPFASLLAHLDQLARAIEEEESSSERRQAAAYIRAGCREAAASEATGDAVGELVPYLSSACALLATPRSDAPSPSWEALAEVMRVLGAEPAELAGGKTPDEHSN